MPTTAVSPAVRPAELATPESVLHIYTFGPWLLGSAPDLCSQLAFDMASCSKAFDSGYLRVDDIHTIYYEQYGRPDGKPGMLTHQSVAQSFRG